MVGRVVGMAGWLLLVTGCELLFPTLTPTSNPPRNTSSGTSGDLPVVPEAGTAGPAAQARTDMTLAMPVASAILLQSGRLLTADATTLTLTTVDGSAAPVSHAHALGVLRFAVEAPGGVWCFGSASVAVVTPEGLVESPLAHQVDTTQLLGVHVLGAEVWLHMVDRLVRLSGGRARDVVVGGVTLEDAKVMVGGLFQDAPAVWLLSGGTLYAVQSTQDGVGAWRVRGDLTAQDLAVDAVGNVMLRDAAGDLHLRAPDGSWHWIRLDAPVETVAGAQQSQEIWLQVAGVWRIWSEGRFRAVSTIPTGTLAGLGPDGWALFTSQDSLAVARVRSRVTLSGVPSDGVLLEAVTVGVGGEDAADIRRVKMQVDDNPEQDVLLPNPSFILNPNALGVGSHTVRVTVGFRAEALSATARARVNVVEVRDPTWTLDIQPLFQERCNRCHGTRGSAHRMETSAIWQEEITDIMAALRAGRMPLNSNALSAGQIALIEQWATVGFPE